MQHSNDTLTATFQINAAQVIVSGPALVVEDIRKRLSQQPRATRTQRVTERTQFRERMREGRYEGLGYNGMAEDLAVNHETVRGWVAQDFPEEFEKRAKPIPAVEAA